MWTLDHLLNCDWWLFSVISNACMRSIVHVFFDFLCHFSVLFYYKSTSSHAHSNHLSCYNTEMSLYSLFSYTHYSFISITYMFFFCIVVLFLFYSAMFFSFATITNVTWNAVKWNVEHTILNSIFFPFF